MPESQDNEVNDIFKKSAPVAQPVKKPATQSTPATLGDIMKHQTSKVDSANNLSKEEIEQIEAGQSKFITFILDLALNLLIVFGLVFIIQNFIASPFKVFGPSMCNTLNYIEDTCLHGYGEYIIVNKLVYKDFFGWSLTEPDRGDIIVFHPPHNNKEFFIKRIIGVAGDTIKLIDGKVYLFNEKYETGLELEESYLSETNSGNTLPSSNRITTFEVPDGQFFVMGDNRNASTDSRSCFRDVFQGGCRGDEAYFLPRKNIEGRAWVVLWPFNKIRILDRGDYSE